MTKESHLVNVYHGVNIMEYLVKSHEYDVTYYVLFRTVFTNWMGLTCCILSSSPLRGKEPVC